LLDDTLWDALKPKLPAASIGALVALTKEARTNAAWLKATGMPRPARATGDPTPTPGGLAAITGVRDKATKELGLDQENVKKRTLMEQRLVTLKGNEAKAGTTVKDAEGAIMRMRAVQQDRLAAYERVFSSLDDERDALVRLYEPLSERVRRDPRLSKLAVVVNRVVDIAAWARRGEDLFDLRRPPFSGHGYLEKEAATRLKAAWVTGSPSDVVAAMRDFYEGPVSKALDALAQGKTPQDVGSWFFSTDHISIRYSIEYEGVQIARLSPGTRGVVLLTLYLALDEWDVRPLLIDQPEENLDPSSVYDDLVPFFRDAAERRQIIMVTHNANLVVNTDADQVIVANAVRPDLVSLPHFTYESGGLEDPFIRAHVCRLLEGGEDAFRKRGLRYDLRNG
jgi:hypothetical protein